MARKLSDDDVSLLRALYAERQAALDRVAELTAQRQAAIEEARRLTMVKLAEKFDISHPSVSRVVKKSRNAS